MESTGTLPADLAEMAPGPRLGALLAGLDPAGLEGADRLTVVEAWQRQEAHARAGLYRWMAAVGSAPGAAPEWTEEIRAALSWTRRAADRRTDEACALVTELPAVWAALAAGLIDAPRAVVFVDHLAGLPDPLRPTDTGSKPGSPGHANSGPSSSGASRSPHPADRGARPRQGVHLQVALSTLLGLDERPAELPELGPVPASRVRELVAAQRGAPWRYAITGRDGRVVRTGALRRRPDRQAVPCTDPATPGLVDILVDATLLAKLADDPPRTACPPAHAWREVFAEIDTACERPLDDAPRARFPHTGLRRHIELRDRYCNFPGCLAPAHSADLDHTVDHARGGTTTAGGLGLACRHDHGLRQRGWHLDQPEPGSFRWRSPLGRSDRTRSEPLLPPLPTPVRHGPDPELDGEPRPSEAPLLVWRPDPPPPAPCPPPPVELDEPPPF